VSAGEVRVRRDPVGVLVPASTANLGPGFDSIGLALGLYDRCEAVVLPDPNELVVRVSGQGADEVPLDESHLVVRALRAGLERAGARQPGLELTCTNVVPHGRGLGSSATAVVAGLSLARALVPAQALVPARRDPADARPLDVATLLDLATQFEGHPDNVSASLLGGLTVSWTDPDTGRASSTSLVVHPDIHPVVCVPSCELATAKARAMLPPTVPHRDAAFTAGRAALLVEAMSRRPDLLFPATEERLHQSYRAPAMPASLDLVRRLRADGLAAVVSGAGPTVLVLAVEGSPLEGVTRCTGDEWDVTHLTVDTQGARLVAVGN
jgi:homoserine kinase